MRKVLLFFAMLACAVASWAEDVVTATYTSSKIDVALANTTEFVAFQMDIKAEGVDFNGKEVTLNDERLNQTGNATIGGSSVAAPFVLAKNVLPDGTLRVIAYNLANRSLSLTEGSLFEVAVDNKPTAVTLSNVLFVKKSDLAEVQVNATAVEGADFILGDVNQDTNVDLFDVVGALSIIKQVPDEGLNETAADVNGDGTVDLFDVVGILEIIKSNN